MHNVLLALAVWAAPWLAGGAYLAALAQHGAPQAVRSAQQGSGVPPVDLARAADFIVRATGEQRGGRKLEPLAPSMPLAQAAQAFAHYMARTDHYGHEADGRVPADRAR